MSFPSPLDVVRVNTTTWSWNSIAFSIDNLPNEGIVGIDYEEELETRIIYSNAQDGPPLGQSAGRYKVARFPLRMLRDSAKALKNYLAAKATAQGTGSYGQVLFSLSMQLSALDAADGSPSSVVFSSCRIVGENATHDEGAGVAVTEFQIGCLLILQDGATLWNALQLPPGAPAAAFPSVDSITIGNVPAPGKWTLTKGPREYGWDIRKGYGLSGATVVPTGDTVLEAEFRVELWDPADYVLFKAFRSQFLKKSLVAIPGGVRAMALGLDHPELLELGAKAFVVKKVEPLVNDDFGVWTCAVTFLEYRKPLPALPKPSAAIPDTIAPQPTAQDAADVELQALRAQFQALANR